MKAVIIDNKIKVFNQIPNEWKNYLNFSQADEQLLKQEGFYDLVEPTYDPNLQKLGDIYFDDINEVFIYNIVNIEYDINVILNNKLNEFNTFQKQMRKEIVELFLEEMVLGTLTQSVKDVIHQMNIRKNEIYLELNQLAKDNNISKLLNYKFYTEETELFRQILINLKNTIK